jgi:hypothetical protein
LTDLKINSDKRRKFWEMVGDIFPGEYDEDQVRWLIETDTDGWGLVFMFLCFYQVQESVAWRQMWSDFDEPTPLPFFDHSDLLNRLYESLKMAKAH